MNFTKTSIPGAFVLTQDRKEDDRGFFTRVWCHQELATHGLDPTLAQASLSHNHKRGTLRGMHLQKAPGVESKLVTCTRGRLYDVLLDLRPASPTYLRWFGTELSADNGKMLYIPAGLAHGYVTLADETEVLYHINVDHQPELATGVRWDDPAFGIVWPIAPQIMSDRDRTYADFSGARDMAREPDPKKF